MTKVEETKQFLVYNKGNYDEMRKYMNDTDWSQIYKESTSVEESWSLIKEILNTCVNKFVPLRKSKKEINKPSWMTAEVLITVKKKNRAYKRYLKSKTEFDKKVYNCLKNQSARVIKNAKREFERRIAQECKTNSKAFWKYIKSKTYSKEIIGKLNYD